MKKISLILMLCALFSIITAQPASSEITDSGTCGDNLTWTFDDNGTLTISGEGEMYYFYQSLFPWYSKEIKNIVLEEGITSIGDGAFINCSSLTQIAIPDSVTSIGDSAFKFCSSLTNISIPDSVTYIGTEAFYNCSKLTNVYYSGNTLDKIKIKSGNDWLKKANIHYGQTFPQYSVTYNPNGGSQSPNPQNCPEGGTLILANTIPTKSKYTFLGWSLTPDAQEAEYQPGDTVKVNSDMVLYAVWKKTSYTATTKVNNIFLVSPTSIPIGSSIMFTCYSNGQLVHTEEYKYNNEPIIPFYVSEQYDNAKVFVWNGIGSVIPVTDPENI